MRKIHYITGTRADFGLMEKTLLALHQDKNIDLSLIVTGMHLDKNFGETIKEIKNTALNIETEIPLIMRPQKGATMAKALGVLIQKLTKLWSENPPNAILLLGDRGEMLAAAIAALHLNIPTIHIHGGERSGTIDESMRHAISKLSHIHLTATKEAKERLIKMGEKKDHIFYVGAPGLDGIEELGYLSRHELCHKAQFDENDKSPIALLVFHPVVQEQAESGTQIEQILEALNKKKYRIIALMPNGDAGAKAVAKKLQTYHETHPYQCRLYTHLERTHFVSWMKHADIMIGNSSAGIIEAASFGTPVLNIGSRQKMRERSLNIIDTPANTNAIENALAKAIKQKRFPKTNLYGDGKTAQKIQQLIATIDLPPTLLDKCNAY